MKLTALDRLFPEWHAIHRHEAQLGDVAFNAQQMVLRHNGDMLRLRAMFEGLVEVLNEKVGIDDKALETAVQRAWSRMTSVGEPVQAATDPYRGIPAEPTLAKCDVCGRSMDASHTTVMLDGQVRCETCA
jgi:hypothetical protein